MKKRLALILFSAFLILLFASLFVSTSKGEKSGNAKVDAAVYEKLASEGKVRVFVYMKEPAKVSAVKAKSFEKIKEIKEVKAEVLSNFSVLD